MTAVKSWKLLHCWSLATLQVVDSTLQVVESTMLHFFGFFQYSVKVLVTYNFAHMKNSDESPYVDMIWAAHPPERKSKLMV
jgi:hypothetical protein